MLQVLKTRTKRYKVGCETFLSVPRSDTVRSSLTETSAFHSPQENGENSVLETLSRVHSFHWLRAFLKSNSGYLWTPLIKCFESRYVKSMLFHFPMTVVLFQRIWSFSFNRFVSLNQVHRMANQVGDKSQRAVHLNFSKVSDFHCLRIAWFLLFLIQFELRDSENYHSQLKSLLPKIQKRDLARVSIIRQTYYS